MEQLWDRNMALTTRLVDTVTLPMLLKVVLSGKLQPEKLVTHHFALRDIFRRCLFYAVILNGVKDPCISSLSVSSPHRFQSSNRSS
jgi:hypothetical protein